MVEDAISAPEMIESGSWYEVVQWPHDGRPFETDNFVVYSDGAGEDARKEAAEVAERAWTDLFDEFGVNPGMLRFPAGQNKVHLYVYKEYDPSDWAGRAYYGGLLIWSPDHEGRRYRSESYGATLKHELIHVIHGLLLGNNAPQVDVWFFEGLPEAVTGGTAGGAIRGRDQLQRLTTEYGPISPISIRRYSQITDPEAGEHFFYPMFQLAVEYLIDDEGRGRSIEDVGALMIDVAEGAAFEDAFEARMGMRLDDYEEQFFGLVNAYLPKYRNRAFTPVGFGLISVLVTGVAIGAVAVEYDRKRRAIAIGRTSEWGRSAMVAFFMEIAIAIIIVVGFFLGGLFSVGTEDGLYNASNTSIRMWAYRILVGYLLASIALLLWAVHSWFRRSRSVYLVVPGVVATSGVTLYLLSAIS